MNWITTLQLTKGGKYKLLEKKKKKKKANLFEPAGENMMHVLAY
jgi:hypothetical protein